MKSGIAQPKSEKDGEEEVDGKEKGAEITREEFLFLLC